MLEVTGDHDSQSTGGLDESEGHKVVEEGHSAQRAKDKHRVRPGIGGGRVGGWGRGRGVTLWAGYGYGLSPFNTKIMY